MMGKTQICPQVIDQICNDMMPRPAGLRNDILRSLEAGPVLGRPLRAMRSSALGGRVVCSGYIVLDATQHLSSERKVNLMLRVVTDFVSVGFSGAGALQISCGVAGSPE